MLLGTAGAAPSVPPSRPSKPVAAHERQRPTRDFAASTGEADSLPLFDRTRVPVETIEVLPPEVAGLAPELYVRRDRGQHAAWLTLTFVLHGRMSTKQRAALIAALDALSPDAPRLLLATGKLVGEGFDHPPLDTLVLAMPVSWLSGDGVSRRFECAVCRQS